MSRANKFLAVRSQAVHQVGVSSILMLPPEIHRLRVLLRARQTSHQQQRQQESAHGGGYEDTLD